MAIDNTLKTPVFDWDKGDFATDLQGGVITAQGAEAVVQIIIKAQQTPRGRFPVYADVDNLDLSHKYGNDSQEILRADMSEEIKLSELRRATQEAIIYDPWIKAVRSVTITRTGTDEATAEFEVDHIFGTTTVEGVSIGNG